MATLVFTALGTAIGGPLGGAVGSLIGNQLDRAVFGGGKREGPRLKELAVSTSSYGAPVARHFGAMRVPGTIVWATDLVESSEKHGGGKGSPSTTSYSYSCSLAVALGSRPILRVGRIWADGNLLRGSAGDLKTGGTLRIYTGHGDQPADPLIAADRGGECPAFRDFAYCVFESLQLADFGNRVPALSFEVIADDGEVTLTNVLSDLDEPLEVSLPLTGLVGMSDEGGSLAGTLAALDQLYPLACDAGGGTLSIGVADAIASAPVTLSAAAIDDADGSFGAAAGTLRKRHANLGEAPSALRYYEVSRDYQIGVQRTEGRAAPGRSQTIEFAGAFDAATARGLVDTAAKRAVWARETLAWRTAELDPAVGPGAVVRAPGYPGLWSVDNWEWRERGIELDLRRLPPTVTAPLPVDAGEALPKPDLVTTPTQLIAFELPWDGHGSGDVRQAFAAASSSGAGWTGAAFYAARAGELIPLGTTGPRRSVIGETVSALAPSPALLFEPCACLEVDLASPDFQFTGASPEALAQGANRAAVGDEVIQFAGAERIGPARWKLTGLLRGRGGTEPSALAGHSIGVLFALLDGTPVPLDPAIVGRDGEVLVAAIGLADPQPVTAPLRGAGSTTRPLSPVHPFARRAADGSLELRWIRRARGAWTWSDGVDAPLNEETERYFVGLGDPAAPTVGWEVTEPALTLTGETVEQLAAAYPAHPLWVRQIGRFSASPALLLTTVA